MYCRILSAAISGVEAVPVFVEADLSEGMPSFNIVGSVSSNVREAQDRVRTALKNVKVFMPPKRLTLNLAPGDIRKEGARFDLPIAAAILAILEKIPGNALADTMVLGELGLDGRVNRIPGVLPSILCARQMGIHNCIIPTDNLHEARAFGGINAVGIRSLAEMIAYCKGEFLPENTPPPDPETEFPSCDFSDIKGQESVKRAALISAAGFHNLLLSGPPGSGKSMTARRIAGILPEMTLQEQQEVSVVYSVAGLLGPECPVITRRPFRAPHHSLSEQALCGGGRIPRPGEITLAHRGVLFIDELPYMPARNLECLRAPLEERTIRISRTFGSYVFPANFLFVAAMNPCPCGYYPDMEKCRCTEKDIRSYTARISQPILDRIDICTEVASIPYTDLNSEKNTGSSSAKMRKTVSDAFERQKERYKGLDFCFNSELPAQEIRRFCRTTKSAEKLIAAAFDRLSLSARGYHRILKLSRTIADLEGAETITEDHVSESLCYRQRGK